MNPRRAVHAAIRERLKRFTGIWPIVAANRTRDPLPRTAHVVLSPAGDVATDVALPGVASERTRQYSGLVQALLKLPVDSGIADSDQQADLIEEALCRSAGLADAMTLDDGSIVTIDDVDVRPPRPPIDGFVQRPVMIRYHVTVYFPAT